MRRDMKEMKMRGHEDREREDEEREDEKREDEMDEDEMDEGISETYGMIFSEDESEWEDIGNDNE